MGRALTGHGILRLVVACLCLVAIPARADVDAQTIETYLARGQHAFDDQDYAVAVQTLAPVTRDARATRAQRLRALELIALAHYITGDAAAARSTFERILDIDPGYQLQDPSGSPKVRAFFDDLKRQLIPGFDPDAGADLDAPPRRPRRRPGRPLEIEARVTRGNVFDVVVGERAAASVLGYRVSRRCRRVARAAGEAG